MPRVTITKRHTDRYHIGLSMTDFWTLSGEILLSEKLTGSYQIPGEPTEYAASRARVRAAFRAYTAKIKRPIQS